jgi:hypothetical protein
LIGRFIVVAEPVELWEAGGRKTLLCGVRPPRTREAIRRILALDEDNSVAAWYDEDLHLRLAARDLLSAAEKILDHWQNTDIGEVIHELCCRRPHEGRRRISAASLRNDFDLVFRSP